MRYTLENDTLHVEIDSFGAELKSVRSVKDGQEFMWYGDKKYWGRTSPVLFPFVGSLKNKEYHFQGKTYPMGQHGFARDMEHSLSFETDNEIWFALASNEETLEKYPFPFVLQIGYQLSGNQLKVMWKVANPGEEPMYFSIGAHPAFLCPIHGEDDKNGYQLTFDGADEIHHHGNTRDTGLACMDEDLILPLENHTATITPEFFDRCTYMIENNQTEKVTLSDPAGVPFVSVSFDTPLFAIWSPEEKNAPFVCIEPWFGRCDATDFEGDLEDRDYTQALTAGDLFEAEYMICFESAK